MRSRAFTSTATIVAALLSGCATQSPPDATALRQEAGAAVALDASAAWKAGGDPGEVADNWLATFADPQLDALVQEAMANNPDLRVAAARVEQSAQYVELARADLRPSVRARASGGENMGGGDALQFINIGASWEIDVWGRMRYGRNAALDAYASAQTDFEFARQSLAATVARGWFTATETRLQIRITEDMVASSRELVALAEKRLGIGAGSEQDLALARAGLADMEDALEQARLAHSQAQRALEILVGRYPAAELAAREELPALPGPVPAGLPLGMLERRPDVIAAERRVAAAFNRVGEAKAARLPKISLNANIAAVASDILELNDDFENPAGVIGASLLAPIYDGGTLKTQVEIRTLEQREATAAYARMALRALSDVEGALAAGRALSQRTAFLERTRAEQQRAFDLAQTSYRVGRIDLRAVQQQQLQLRSAELALLRVRSEQLSQRASLHLALGGSFETPTEVASAEPAAP